jgi:benzodiazapine receptor
MGLSLYIIWNSKAELSKQKYKKQFFIIFGIQLILNASWSFLFFGLKSPLYRLIDILVLYVTVIMTIIYANRVSKYSAILLAPYMAWITFATLLNFGIVLLNK